MNTSFPAFSTPNRFLKLECTRPNEEKTLSTPADDAVVVSNCITTLLVSACKRSAWDFHCTLYQQLHLIDTRLVGSTILMGGDRGISPPPKWWQEAFFTSTVDFQCLSSPIFLRFAPPPKIYSLHFALLKFFTGCASGTISYYLYWLLMMISMTMLSIDHRWIQKAYISLCFDEYSIYIQYILYNYLGYYSQLLLYTQYTINYFTVMMMIWFNTNYAYYLWF